jgi:hypothetical protein
VRSLCEGCVWLRVVATSKGSRFLLCRLSGSDAAFPKYPPQPVMTCAGFRDGTTPQQSDGLTVEEAAPE